MTKGHQQEKPKGNIVKIKKENTLKILRTAENRGRRQKKELQRQEKRSERMTTPTPRGTARRTRREAWATIRKLEDKIETSMIWNSEKKAFVPHTYRVKRWSPTFAQFSKGVRHG